MINSSLRALLMQSTTTQPGVEDIEDSMPLSPQDPVDQDPVDQGPTVDEIIEEVDVTDKDVEEVIDGGQDLVAAMEHLVRYDQFLDRCIDEGGINRQTAESVALGLEHLVMTTGLEMIVAGVEDVGAGTSGRQFANDVKDKIGSAFKTVIDALVRMLTALRDAFIRGMENIFGGKVLLTKRVRTLRESLLRAKSEPSSTDPITYRAVPLIGVDGSVESPTVAISSLARSVASIKSLRTAAENGANSIFTGMTKYNITGDPTLERVNVNKAIAGAYTVFKTFDDGVDATDGSVNKVLKFQGNRQLVVRIPDVSKPEEISSVVTASDVVPTYDKLNPEDPAYQVSESLMSVSELRGNVRNLERTLTDVEPGNFKKLFESALNSAKAIQRDADRAYTAENVTGHRANGERFASSLSQFVSLYSGINLKANKELVKTAGAITRVLEAHAARY